MTMFPFDVSITMRYWLSSSIVSCVKGTGGGGGIGRIVTLLTSIAILRNLFVVDRRGRDLIHDFDPFHDTGERGELAGELQLIRHANHKLRAGAVGFSREQRCENRPLFKLDAAHLRLETHVESARSVFRARLNVFAFGVSGLNDAVWNHAVERCAVVETLAGKVDELLHVVRRFFGIELECECSRRGVENRLELAWVFLLKQHQCHQ